MKIHEGQKLWFVGDHRYHGHDFQIEVSVEKVGRKWAILDNGARVNIKTFRTDSFAKCYLSKEDYEEERNLNNAWYDLVKKVRGWGPVPDGVTEDDIKKASELLKL